MRRNLFITLTLSVLCFGLLLTSGPQAAQAQRARGRRHLEQTVNQIMTNMTQKLDLTDDQKTKIRPIVESHVVQAHAIHKDPTISPQDQKAQIKTLQANTLSQIKPILTADQLQKVASMKHGGAELLSPKHTATPQEELAHLSILLNLTDDQKQKILPILQTAHTKAAVVRQDSTLSKVQKQAQLQEIHTTARTQINAVLTPDQQQKFAAIGHG